MTARSLALACSLLAASTAVALDGCAGWTPRPAAKSALASLVVEAGRGLAELVEANEAAYADRGAAVRAALPDAGRDDRLAAYDAQMAPTVRLFDARVIALVEARRALERCAQLLDDGRVLDRQDAELALRALSALVSAATEGALGLPPLRAPPPLLQLLNLLAAASRTDGGIQ